MVENTFEGGKGVFQGLHMTFVTSLCLFIILYFIFLILNLILYV
jgi:hypothetical protein